MPWKDKAIDAVSDMRRSISSRATSVLESFKVMVGNVSEWIMPKDERKPPPDATKKPWCAICYLEGNLAQGGTIKGTGFLINPTTVVTAAHNLCEIQYGKAVEVKDLKVFPGRATSASTIKSIVATRYVYDKRYVAAPKPGGLDRSCYDYGLIFLNEPVNTDQSFYFDTVAIEPDSKDCRNPLSCGGYPQEKKFALMCDHEKEPWPPTVSRFSDNGRLLLHDIYVSGGQSGAPIFMESSGQVVAIHVRINKGKSAWAGVCITQEMKKAFDLWKSNSTAGKIGKSHAADFDNPNALV
jgi:V8-like Glu-specific endopeptidase